VTVLVLGIVGVAIPLVAFPAWFVGNRALADVRRHPGRYDNADLIRVGRMLGKVISILMMVELLVLLGVLVFFYWPAVNS
jgi:hypothetical protein